MREQEKLKILRNIAISCAKSIKVNQNDVSDESNEKIAVASLSSYFHDGEVITDEERHYFLTYFRENIKNIK